MKNKKTLKLWTLVILGLLVVTGVLYKTCAATSPVVTLQITAWSITCGNPGTLTFNAVAAWFTTQEVFSWFLANTWYCTDLKWTDATRSKTIIMAATTGLQNQYWQWITSWNVSASWSAQTVSQWSCTAWSALSKTVIWATATPATVLNKASAAWQICSLSGSVTVFVTIPANQAVGTYTWTINVADPS